MAAVCAAAAAAVAERAKLLTKLSMSNSLGVTNISSSSLFAIGSAFKLSLIPPS